MEILSPVTVRDENGVSRKVARVENTEGDPGDTIFVGDNLPAEPVAGDVRLSLQGGSPGVGGGQAAQITAFDPATGRLAIGGIELGSTGPVPITLKPEWTTGTVTLARTGDIVTMEATGLSGPSTNQHILTDDPDGGLPVGFWPLALRNFSVTVSGSLGTPGMTGLRVAGPTVLLGGGGVGDIVAGYFSVSWRTDDPWPASI